VTLTNSWSTLCSVAEIKRVTLRYNLDAINWSLNVLTFHTDTVRRRIRLYFSNEVKLLVPKCNLLQCQDQWRRRDTRYVLSYITVLQTLCKHFIHNAYVLAISFSVHQPFFDSTVPFFLYILLFSYIFSWRCFLSRRNSSFLRTTNFRSITFFSRIHTMGLRHYIISVLTTKFNNITFCKM